MTSDQERTAKQHFRRGSRLPPLLSAFIVFIVVMTIVVTFGGEAPANPDAWWQAPLSMAVILAVVTAVVAYETGGAVEVTDAGLLVGKRLEVPAREVGAVELLRGWDAYHLGTTTWLHNDRRTHPIRQNRYGGGGLGKGVLVERVLPGGRSTFWLLPGPRAAELAAALETVRVMADRRGEDDTGDEAWPTKVVRRGRTRR